MTTLTGSKKFLGTGVRTVEFFNFWGVQLLSPPSPKCSLPIQHAPTKSYHSPIATYDPIYQGFHVHIHPLPCSDVQISNYGGKEVKCYFDLGGIIYNGLHCTAYSEHM